MTTRQDLHEAIDKLTDEQVKKVIEAVKPIVESNPYEILKVRPEFVFLTSGPRNTRHSSPLTSPRKGNSHLSSSFVSGDDRLLPRLERLD